MIQPYLHNTVMVVGPHQELALELEGLSMEIGGIFP